MSNSFFIVLTIFPLFVLAQKPKLIVPTGHPNGISNVQFSKNSQYLFTHDKNVVKLWDLKGRELQSFQPIFPELEMVLLANDGQHLLTQSSGEYGETAVSMWHFDGTLVDTLRIDAQDSYISNQFSPDGRFWLTGMPDGTIRRFELNTKQLDKSYIKAHNAEITHLEFSPDGSKILTGSQEEAITKLWDVQKKKRLATFKGTGQLSFSPNGQYLLEVVKDRWYSKDTAHLYALNGSILKTVDGAKNLTFSPGGNYLIYEPQKGIPQLLSLNDDKDYLLKGPFGLTAGDELVILANPEENILEQIDLKTGTQTTIATIPGMVKFIAISPDQKRFLTLEEENGISTVKQWDLKTQTLKAEKSFRRSLTQLDYAPNGQFLFFVLKQEVDYSTIYDNYIMDHRFNVIGQLESHAKSMANVFLSTDGKYLTNGWNRFHLETSTIDTQSIERPFYTQKTGDVLHSPSRNATFGTDGSEPYPSLSGDTSDIDFVGHESWVSAQAFSHDGQFIATGSWDRTARLWDLQGNTLQVFRGHNKPIESVSIGPNNKWVLTGSALMAKLWHRDAPTALFSLILIDDSDWIVTNPSGLFDATPNAFPYMHYSVFYERDQEYIVIDVEQLKTRYYEPGLLQKVLGFSNERLRPVELFENVALYPKVTRKEIKSDSLFLELKARNGGIGKVTLFINGKEVINEINPAPRRENGKRDSVLTHDLRPYQKYFFRHPDSTNTVSIRVYNEEGWLKSASIDLPYSISSNSKGTGSIHQAPKDWEAEFKPKLYVVSVGTKDYIGTELDLQYPDLDAMAMAKAFQSLGKSLFNAADSVEVYCLTTSNSDSLELEKQGIQWRLSGKPQIGDTFSHIQSKAKAEDILIVYFSGHGVTQSSGDYVQFHYLTKDVASENDLDDPATLKTFTISTQELTQWINGVPALKQVLIVDACNSGKIVENLSNATKRLNSSQIRALDRMKDRTGMFVLSGSASDKVSYEASEFGQGLLTYALLKGMKGRAIENRSGTDYIDVMNLFQYARNEVPKLAKRIKGIQTPMMGFPNKAASFDIGIFNEDIDIPLNEGKPVFIRPNFMDLEALTDAENLKKETQFVFEKENKRGQKASFLFVDVENYPDAFRVGGYYQKREGAYHLTARLFSGNRHLDLSVAPANTPKALAFEIYKSITDLIKTKDPFFEIGDPEK